MRRTPTPSTSESTLASTRRKQVRIAHACKISSDGAHFRRSDECTGEPALVHEQQSMGAHETSRRMPACEVRRNFPTVDDGSPFHGQWATQKLMSCLQRKDNLSGAGSLCWATVATWLNLFIMMCQRTVLRSELPAWVPRMFWICRNCASAGTKYWPTEM